MWRDVTNKMHGTTDVLNDLIYLFTVLLIVSAKVILYY